MAMNNKEFEKKYYHKIDFRKGFSPVEQTIINISKSSSIISNYYYQFLKIFSKLPKKAKVLDLGIADGSFTHFMYRLRPEIEYHGLDLTNVKEILPKYVKFHKEDATKFDIKEKFDLIVCNHLIEHLETDQVIEVFKQARKHLKPKGILWLTTPNLSKEFFNDPTHVRPYTKVALEKLFRMTDYKEIEAYEGNYQNKLISIIKSLFKKHLKITYGYGKK